jgi:hypothetical protein
MRRTKKIRSSCNGFKGPFRPPETWDTWVPVSGIGTPCNTRTFSGQNRYSLRRFSRVCFRHWCSFQCAAEKSSKRSPQGVGSEKGRSVQVLQKNSEKFFKANKKTPLGGTAKGAAQGRKSEMKS